MGWLGWGPLSLPKRRRDKRKGPQKGRREKGPKKGEEKREKRMGWFGWGWFGWGWFGSPYPKLPLVGGVWSLFKERGAGSLEFI